MVQSERPRRIGWPSVFGALVISLALASAAQGQISGVGITNTGDGDSTNNGITDGEQRLSATTVNSTSTTISGRYAWVTAADSGIFTNSSINLNAAYRVDFTVNVPGAYILTVNTNWNGGFTTVDDGGGTATADVGALTGGQTGGTLATGTLSLGDPGSRASGSTGQTNFGVNPLSAAATINGLSNGSNVAHQLTFSWASSCNSPGGAQIVGADECAVRAGLASTLSGQTAGAYPGAGGLARTQANDGHFVNVSIVSLCGNSVVDGSFGEQCDEGSQNGLSSSCCTQNCQFRAGGQGCRASAGQCDIEETCTGSSGACPADVFEPNTTICRAASPGELCDETETCTGSGPNCPADEVVDAGTTCRASLGACDLTEVCDGASKLCPNDDKVPNGTECRAQNGACDVAEVCNGTGNLCPPNGFQPIGTLCRGVAGVCDIQELCTGGPNCPADAFESSSVECRADAGECDVAENCPGNGPNCPPNGFEPNGTLCTDDGETCTTDECDGNNNCTHPAGNAGTECRAASAGQLCDEAEECDGVNTTCPADAPKPASTVCRAASAGLECDEVEVCDGVSFDCPFDAVKSNGTLCRADSGECDVEELCDGVNFDCPTDAFEPNGTLCTDDGAICTVDICDGNNNCTHPAGNAGTECRAGSAGMLCDEPEECDGINTTCPADAPKSAGVECRAGSVGQLCDEPEECDGVSFQCPADDPKPNGAVCRADTGECDVQEVCDGVAFTCPADGFEPAGTACTSDGETCTVDECDGNNNCTHDAGNAGTTCRADAGECDVEETCDGSNPTCPADGFVFDGTPCTDDGLFCTGDETCQSGSCDGSGDPCGVGTCDEPTDQCLTVGCEGTPLNTCRPALKSILVVKDNESNDAKDKLIWKWLKGASTTQVEFADPTSTADYTLCIYSGATEDLVSESVVPPSNTLWKPISTKGYKYKDGNGTQAGITKVILKGSSSPNKSKALVKGKGTDLDDIPPAANPTLDLDLPVRVQLVNEDNGTCFEADYQAGDVKKNIPGKFKAKAQ